MIIILYQSGCQGIAQKVAKDLRNAFTNHVTVALIAASSSSSWPTEPSWDDLLIVMHNGQKFPAKGNSFIRQFIKKRPQSANLLPVALDLSATKPPKAAEKIKALEYDKAAKGPTGRLANRVGCMLGLRIQGRDCKIFISYRATDGTTIAKQLHSRLKGLGYSPYLDEAKGDDGETEVLPGAVVQAQIDEALDKANLLLLIDTPSAPSSWWIAHEVETADSLLLPILPICVWDKGGQLLAPRFDSLRQLKRWVLTQSPNMKKASPLNASQLDQIVSEAEQYLCEIFKRKCRVPLLVQKEFLDRGFAWKVLNQRLLMFESSKSNNWRVRTKVLSHCSIFDMIYAPAIKRFITFLKDTGRSNYSLFIYDGSELLPAPQLQTIAEKAQDSGVIILHHQELATLIDANFTNLAAA